jgi:hypothetical protein
MLVTLLLAGTVAFAQSSDPGGAGMGAPSAGQEQSGMSGMSQDKIQGCLSGSEGNFTLTSATGTTYRLQGKEDDLKKEVGHEVEIEVDRSASQSASAGAGQTGGATGAATAEAGAAGQSGQDTSGAIAGRADSGAAAGGASAAAETVQVKDVNKIADTCSSSPSTSPGMGGAGSDTQAQPPTP